MKNRQRTQYILDIGNYSLKLLTVDTSRRLPCIVGMHTVPLKFDILRSLANKEKHERIAEALKQLFAREPKAARRHLTVLLPNTSLFTRFVNLPNIQRSKLNQIIKFEVEQQIPFIIDEVCWAYEIISSPHAYDLSILIAAIRNHDIELLSEIVTMLHIHVDTYTISHVAYVNLMQYLLPEEKNALIVDLGDAVTSLVLITEDKTWGRNLLTGCDKLTFELASQLGLDFKTAEKVKRHLAFAPTVEENKKRKETLNEANRLALDIGERFFDGLLNEIQRSMSFYFSLSRQMNVGTIYLTGGGATIEGVENIFRYRFEVPIKKLDISAGVTIAPSLKQKLTNECPFFMPSIGVAVSGQLKNPLVIDLLPHKEKRKRSLLAAKKRFSRFALLFFVCIMGISLFFFYVNTQFKTMASRLNERLRYYQQCSQHETQLEQSLSHFEDRFKTIDAYARDKFLIPAIVDVLATHLPDSMWITSFSLAENNVLTLAGTSRGTLADINYFQNVLNLEPLFSQVTIKEANIIRNEEKQDGTTRTFILTMIVERNAL